MRAWPWLLAGGAVCVAAGAALQRGAPETLPPLIPWPADVRPEPGHFRLTTLTPVAVTDTSNAELLGMAGFAADVVRERLGRTARLAPAPATSATRDAIVLALDPAADSSREAYHLTVRPAGIAITAAAPTGLFYGIQTLRQLVPHGSDGHVAVPAVTIADRPRFGYRGMHLDVGRHLFPVPFIKRYIDLLARYKFNTFHWHLTDDQGWRIEIARYPRLTQVGAWRRETIKDKNFDPFIGDGLPYGGFYAQDEVRDIVAYARARHVTIIPEIEMPGHSVAALAAYPELACTRGPFEVGVRWGVYDDVFCPTERTFTFLENVLGEVIALFPGTYIHIGGDEVPKRRWQESRETQAIIRREGLKDEAELQSWFIRRIERFLISHNRRLIGWDEILEGGLAPEATVMSWRGTDGGIAAALQGHDAIMTPGSHLYFDHYQGDSASEPLAIGGFTPLEKVYAYEPVPDTLTAAAAKHILGAQANVWTEYIASPEQVEYMALPRMLALAEVVWSPREARDWESFRTRLGPELRALDPLAVHYRVPHVEGLERDRLTLADSVSLQLRSIRRDAVIRYTLDGTDPDSTARRFTGPVTIPVTTGGVRVTARAFLPGGRVSPPRAAWFRHAALRPPDPDTAGLAPGVRARYVEFPRRVRRVAALDSVRAARDTVVPAIALTGSERPEWFGWTFRGLVRVPASGVYTFTLTSDDGSTLAIGDSVVVDFDGYHGEQDWSGQAALAAGSHPITVRYFQATGGKALAVRVALAGAGDQPLPPEWLRHRP